MASQPSTESITKAGLGPLIRMRALTVDKLPAHPDLASQQKAAPDIQTFASTALEEGHAFMTSYLHQKFAVKDDKKQSPPCTAPVKVLSHDISTSERPAEAREAGATNESWFARISVHENAAKDGTASWEEFDGGLRVDHSRNEQNYTPSIDDAHEVMTWDSQLEQSQRRAGSWEDVHVGVMEMVHQLPAPLSKRVFSVLVLAGKRGNEFIDVQIPVVTRELPNSKYHDAPKMVGGMYCSVERGELIENGTKVEWQMATASDAKGVLPMWAQKMGVPGAIVKDVGFFVEWCAKTRKGQNS